MKEIIFFDGDGTLWYPKTTKHKKAPHWVYQKRGGPEYHNRHFVLTPTALKTLQKLKKKKIITVVLSTHPHHPKEAETVIKEKIKHFNLSSLFDEVYATRDFHGSKGEFMVKILKKRGIPKKRALMVGDQYNWDYKPAKENGIDAVLIESDYLRLNPKAKKVKRTIKRLKDIFKYLDIK